MKWMFWKYWFDKSDSDGSSAFEINPGLNRPERNLDFTFLAIAFKYAGNFAMIPENLDIDRHILEHPLTDYKFKRMNRKGTEVICSAKNIVFDKDRLAYIIGLISSIPASDKDSICEDGYVRIYSKLIQGFFPDYKCYLDYLIHTGVVISNKHYEVGKFSRGYKLAQEYENVRLVKYVYRRKVQANAETSTAVPKQTLNKDNEDFEDNPLVNIPYLSHWYMDGRLSISSNASSYAWQVRERKFAAGYSNWDDNHSKWDDKNNRYFKKYPGSQYNAAMHNIAAIETGAYNAKIDSNVHRLHSAITNLQKDYRNFLRYDGQELTAMDLSNSQPFLLTILFNPAFWDKNSDSYINIGHLPRNIQDRFPDELLDEIKVYVASIQEDRKSEYIAKASNGEVYEYMMSKANEQYPGCCNDKKDAKTMMFIAFFSSNRYLNQKGAHLKKVFSETFPEIYELIRMSKVNDKTDFACLMQSVESEIILHRCCRRIWDEGEHKVPVFTIHDSIATTSGNVDFVKRIMDEELTMAAGVHPSFKIELWSESNLEVQAIH